MTGYTVAMLVQTKTIVDAAKKASVQHIVHLGAFGAPDTTDPHYVWHQLVETYIQASGIAWTNLHPNVFMDNILWPTFLRDGAVLDFFGGNRVGWVAISDIAKVAAVTLREGPQKHGGKDYWLSSDVVTVKQLSQMLSEALGRDIGYSLKSDPADFEENYGKAPGLQEKWYVAGLRAFFILVRGGEMGYIGTIRDDVQFVTGQPSLKLKEWITTHKEGLLEAANRPSAS